MYVMDVREDGGDFFRKRLAWEWQSMYQKMAHEIARRAIGFKDYFVTRYYPFVSRGKWGSYSDTLQLTLYVDIFVTQHKDVVIPDFRYEYVDNKPRAIEWRCGHCSSPNEISARQCTQCGAPRALLIQEMR